MDKEDPRDEVIRQLTRRLENVERESARARSSPGFSTDSDSPFSRRLRENLMPKTCRLLRPLESYNVIGDLDTFLRKYKRVMELEDANKKTLCKCFEVMLARPASSWFNSLPPNSINSFRELCGKFTIDYIGSKRSSKRAIQMFDITQHPDEPI